MISLSFVLTESKICCNRTRDVVREEIYMFKILSRVRYSSASFNEKALCCQAISNSQQVQWQIFGVMSPLITTFYLIKQTP